MRKRELNTYKQDIYSFLHIPLPTNTEPGLILIISVSDSTNAMLLFCGEVPQAQNSKENIIIVISCFMGDLFGLLNEMV